MLPLSKSIASITGIVALVLPCALTVPADAQQKSAQKTGTRPPTVGIKGAGQMAGAAIRFGEIFGLKSGFTYQVLSARYTIDPFADFIDATNGDEKFVVLNIAIKNNRKIDNWFNSDGHVIQAVDSMNQNFEGSTHIQASKPGEPFSPTLKPGQGLGQSATEQVMVAVKMPQTARLVKLILKQGREGTSEEVIRFFLADATEAEAGGKPDPKNVIAPLPKWAEKGAIIPMGQLVPSNSFYFKLNGYSTAAKLGDAAAEEGKQWVFAEVSVKNAKQAPQAIFSFYLGDSVSQMVLIDADGEKYPAARFVKPKRDDDAEGNLEALEERNFRVAFQVPKNVVFKQARLGSPSHHQFLFDASMAGK